LVPLPLDVGEHRVGLARQTRVTDHPDGLGHASCDSAGLVGSGRTDADGDDHGIRLTTCGVDSDPSAANRVRNLERPAEAWDFTVPGLHPIICATSLTGRSST